MKIKRWREEETGERLLAFFYDKGEEIEVPEIVETLVRVGLRECVIAKKEDDLLPGEPAKLLALMDEGIEVRLLLPARRPPAS